MAQLIKGKSPDQVFSLSYDLPDIDDHKPLIGLVSYWSYLEMELGVEGGKGYTVTAEELGYYIKYKPAIKEVNDVLYFRTSWQPANSGSCDIRRRSLLTMLQNWDKEVIKAGRWLSGTKQIYKKAASPV